uniref:Organic solute carrier partner 1a n=1 Tax=Sinocyclocheilus grahami TaxID=75366 RepID=A0A672KFY7_SINGR
MFNKAFLGALLRQQDLYSHRALRTVLTRIAHASIMRLNPLYDLMAMAFKNQIVLSPRPQDLLLITFNHTDTIKELVKDNPSLVNQISEAQRQLIEEKVYTPLSDGEFHLIRHTLLVLFQDMQIRVSIFLKEKIQNPNGHFVVQTSGPVPYGFEVPGLIRILIVSSSSVAFHWETRRLHGNKIILLQSYTPICKLPSLFAFLYFLEIFYKTTKRVLGEVDIYLQSSV